MLERYEERLASVLKQLSDYREEFVVVGGVCVALYHKQKDHDLTDALFTSDLDLAAEGQVETIEPSIKDRLESLGLEAVKSRKAGARIPKMRFEFPEEEREEEAFEVEFLLPLMGSGEDSSGYWQEDLPAERLRYLDLLLVNPDMVEMQLAGEDVSFQLPSPGMFIVHRALAAGERSDREKEKKDYSYVLDLIDLFSSEFDQLHESIYKAENIHSKYQTWIHNSLEEIESGFQRGRDPLLNAVERLDRISETRGEALVERFIESVERREEPE